MPFNLLLFPLVAGYYLLVRLEYLRYIQHRLDRQRLLFNSVLFGIFVLLITFFIRSIAERLSPHLVVAVYAYLPIKTKFFGTTSFSLLISILFVEVANLIIKREKAIRYAIKYIGDELQLLCKSSFTESRLLQFTLDTGKFYIGWVKELPLPYISNYVRIIPAFSGYRGTMRELIFTTQYLSVYYSYIEEGSVESIDELNSDLVLTVDRIVSAAFFDIEMYERFNSKSD